MKILLTATLALLCVSGARAVSTFSGDYADASARVVLLDIARAAKMTAVLPSDLEDNISAHFDQTPVEKAVAYVSALANADYRLADNTLTVTKRAVVVRPTPSQMTEQDVERAAAAIDREDAARARAARPAKTRETVRVETYVQVRNPYPVPAPTAYRPFAAFAPSPFVNSGLRITPLPSGVYVSRPFGFGYW
jgi:hypothetical protein